MARISSVPTFFRGARLDALEPWWKSGKGRKSAPQRSNLDQIKLLVSTVQSLTYNRLS